MISNDTGLTDGFHVTIRFDGDYKQLNRREVKAACVDRLKLMNMPLGVAYSNPIDIGINTITRNWAGFIKIHLQYPKRDGLAFLRGDRAFVMAMRDGGKVIGKVEKNFELITKARNMRLHLKGESLRDYSPWKSLGISCVIFTITIGTLRFYLLLSPILPKTSRL